VPSEANSERRLAVTGERTTLQDLAKQANELRERLVLVQAELADMEVTGRADGGLVSVTMRGNGEVTRVKFDQAALNQNDAESLAALTLTAIRRATDALKSLTTDKMAAITAGMETGMGTGAANY
jgi:nucleoid-associated protein EbfC